MDDHLRLRPRRRLITKFRAHFQAYIEKNRDHAQPREIAAERSGAFW
jgi:hypothetical protein